MFGNMSSQDYHPQSYVARLAYDTWFCARLRAVIRLAASRRARAYIIARHVRHAWPSRTYPVRRPAVPPSRTFVSFACLRASAVQTPTPKEITHA